MVERTLSHLNRRKAWLRPDLTRIKTSGKPAASGIRRFVFLANGALKVVHFTKKNKTRNLVSEIGIFQKTNRCLAAIKSWYVSKQSKCNGPYSITFVYQDSCRSDWRLGYCHSQWPDLQSHGVPAQLGYNLWRSLTLVVKLSAETIRPDGTKPHRSTMLCQFWFVGVEPSCRTD